MNHPFALELSDLESIDLEFEEYLTPEDATQVGGLTLATTKALGEEGGTPPFDYYTKAWYEGGGWNYPPYYPPNYPPIKPPVDEPPIYTTLALGEEGGDAPIHY
jgi:hypothetical protein